MRPSNRRLQPRPFDNEASRRRETLEWYKGGESKSSGVSVTSIGVCIAAATVVIIVVVVVVVIFKKRSFKYEIASSSSDNSGVHFNVMKHNSRAQKCVKIIDFGKKHEFL